MLRVLKPTKISKCFGHVRGMIRAWFGYVSGTFCAEFGKWFGHDLLAPTQHPARKTSIILHRKKALEHDEQDGSALDLFSNCDPWLLDHWRDNMHGKHEWLRHDLARFSIPSRGAEKGDLKNWEITVVSLNQVEHNTYRNMEVLNFYMNIMEALVGKTSHLFIYNSDTHTKLCEWINI